MSDQPTAPTTDSAPVVTDPGAAIDGSATEGELAVPEAALIPEDVRAVRPEFLTDERDAELREQAAQLAAAIMEKPSDIEITTQLYGLGKEAMTSNTQQVSLMDAKIGPVMEAINVDNPVAKSIVEIKAQLDLINPHVVGQEEVSEIKKKFLGLMKEVTKRLPKAEEVMVRINERRDTVATTVDGLKQHLWTERDKALRNATELGMIANHLFDTQEELQEATYQGQLIWEALNRGRADETDPVRSQSLTYLTNDLSTLVVDLQTVDQLNIQSRLGAENLINNCRQIEKLVHRVTNILLPSVQNALAVKAAAAQQAQLVASSAQIMDAAGAAIRQTAEQVRQTNVKTAKMNTESMIKVDDLQAACAEYEAAQQEMLQIFQKAEENARGVSNTLSDLNGRMRRHADPLTKARLAKEQADV